MIMESRNGHKYATRQIPPPFSGERLGGPITIGLSGSDRRFFGFMVELGTVLAGIVVVFTMS